MKAVAALVCLMALTLAPPAVAYDDCYTDLGADGRICYSFELEEPVPAPYSDSYYLWLGWGDCLPNPANYNCLSKPSSPGSGTPLPVGGSVGFGQFGLLFSESNGCPGLQRFSAVCGGVRPPDNMMLV